LAAGAAVAVLLALPASSATASSVPAPHPAAVKPASLNPGTGVSPAAIPADAMATCADDAYKAGIPYNVNVAGYPAIVVAVAVALAESSCNPNAQNVNGPTSGCPNGSVDRGLWQINNCYHPDVSDACAYNAMCNAIAAYQISNGGTNWKPWATFLSGAYQRYIGAAESAISGLTVTLYNRNTNRCLAADQASTSNGSPVFQWACISGNVYEQWHVEVVAGNLQVLKNVGTGTCLDADGSASGNGAPVFQWNCSADTSPYEQWVIGGNHSLSFDANATLYNWGDHTCLANDSAKVGNGGLIFQWACDTNNGWEQWT
jgi:hypothetical protein